jgi:hypothetical protein
MQARKGRGIVLSGKATLGQLTALCICATLARAHTASSTSGWKLVWSGASTGPANSPTDPASWNVDLGAGGVQRTGAVLMGSFLAKLKWLKTKAMST